MELIKTEFGVLFREDVQQAFQDAIDSKQLKTPEYYMYMHSDETHDYFKHVDTRQYIEVKR